jgi:UDP-galactopyranose mutase
MLPPDQAGAIAGTLLTHETAYSPSKPNDYEYPFPDQANADLAARYRRRADAVQDLLICGRLGEYKYYDMDQAIGRAMLLAEKILAASRFDRKAA